MLIQTCKTFKTKLYRLYISQFSQLNMNIFEISVIIVDEIEFHSIILD